jgi:hypothetical protein
MVYVERQDVLLTSGSYLASCAAQSVYLPVIKLDGPRIRSLYTGDFPHASRQALGTKPASYTMGTGTFPGVKRSGSAEVKDRIEPYFPVCLHGK